jgi:hypothetical protein
MSNESRLFECLASKIVTPAPVRRWGDVTEEMKAEQIIIRTKSAAGSAPPGFGWFDADLICLSAVSEDTDRAKLDALMGAVENLDYTNYSAGGITIMGDVPAPEATVSENELQQAYHIKAVSKRLAVKLT